MSVDTSSELAVERLQALRIDVGGGCIITALGTLNDMNTLCVHLSTLERKVEDLANDRAAADTEAAKLRQEVEGLRSDVKAAEGAYEQQQRIARLYEGRINNAMATLQGL